MRRATQRFTGFRTKVSDAKLVSAAEGRVSSRKKVMLLASRQPDGSFELTNDDAIIAADVLGCQVAERRHHQKRTEHRMKRKWNACLALKCPYVRLSGEAELERLATLSRYPITILGEISNAQGPARASVSNVVSIAVGATFSARRGVCA